MRDVLAHCSDEALAGLAALACPEPGLPAAKAPEAFDWLASQIAAVQMQRAGAAVPDEDALELTPEQALAAADETMRAIGAVQGAAMEFVVAGASKDEVAWNQAQLATALRRFAKRLVFMVEVEKVTGATFH